MYQITEELPEYAPLLEEITYERKGGLNIAAGLLVVSAVGDLAIYLNDYDPRLASGPILGSIVAASLVLGSRNK